MASAMRWSSGEFLVGRARRARRRRPGGPSLPTQPLQKRQSQMVTEGLALKDFPPQLTHNGEKRFLVDKAF